MLKIRLKYKGSKVIISLKEDATIKDAQIKAEQELNTNLEGLWMSLNGRDKLGEADTKLSDVGIVNGDLVKIIDPSKCSQKQDDCPGKLIDSSVGTSSDNNGHTLTVTLTQREHINRSRVKDRETEPGPGPSTDNDKTNTTEAKMETEECNSHTGHSSGLVNRYLYEPLTVQETMATAIPSSLSHAHKEADVTNQPQALFVVLHILMTETGFICESNEATGQTSKWTLPKGWNSNTSKYAITYRHPHSDDVLVVIVGVVMGPWLMVHGQIDKTESTTACKTKLRTSDYVKSLSQETVNCYKELPKLSRIFKDNICHPLFIACQQEMGMLLGSSLSGLFLELKMRILCYLKVEDILRLTEVDKHWNSVSQDQFVWKRLCCRDFFNQSKNDVKQDWKQNYKDLYFQCKEAQRQQRLHVMPAYPDWITRPHPPVPTAPVYPPGFIGGDYDLNPAFHGLGRFPRPRQLHHNPLLTSQREKSSTLLSNRRGHGHFFGPRLF